MSKLATTGAANDTELPAVLKTINDLTAEHNELNEWAQKFGIAEKGGGAASARPPRIESNRSDGL